MVAADAARGIHRADRTTRSCFSEQVEYGGFEGVNVIGHTSQRGRDAGFVKQ
ncbi:hypothetical protein BIWAKO_04221 [Bosea sp. BIWAKO-01]|nr:hypothetical protein BIWAKO_04221 [Bosea sp. BIWAKO-01]